MSAVELDLPDASELDDPFKRWVAVGVVVITLFGSWVAFMAARAAADSDSANREAQRAAIVSMGERTIASSRFTGAVAAANQVEELELQRSIAEARSQALGLQREEAEAQKWLAAAQSLASVSPLLSEAEYRGEQNRVYYAVDQSMPEAVATLRQQALTETADEASAQGDRYLTVITFLAVAVSLLGLSLAFGGRARMVLVLPALLIAGVSIVSVLAVAFRSHTTTDPEAIEAVAQGLRLTERRSYDEALQQFDRALSIRADYAPAYAGRAGARLGAADPDNEGYFFDAVDDDTNRLVIADYRAAIDAGAGDNAQILGNLGASLFYAGEYSEGEQWTRAAIEVNDHIPLLWANLGLLLAAQDRDDEAIQAYATAVERTEARPDRFEREALYASARTELERLAADVPAREALARRIQAQLTAAETESVLGETLGQPPGADAVTDMTITVEPGFVSVDYQAAGLEQGARLAWIWYFRPEGETFWQQRFGTNRFERWGEDEDGSLIDGTSGYRAFSDACPSGGDYRVDLYAEGVLIASAEATRPATVPLENYFDLVAGISLCRPSEWEVEVEQPGTFSVRDPGGDGALTIRSLPVPSARAEADEAAIERTALDATGISGDVQIVSYGLEEGRQRVATGARGSVLVWAAVDDTGVLRTVSAELPAGGSEQVQELLESLVFSAAY